MYRWPGCGSGWRGRRRLLRQAPVTVVTTIEITLPDALAEEAKGAGLLAPEAIEDLLRCKLASDRLKRLQQARIRLSARPEEAMTQEEIQAEIKAYRQEQRIAALRQHQLPTKRS
jgi:post-segregation antitoxin (ccd killing protein)